MQNLLLNTQSLLNREISRFSASLFLVATLVALAGCGSGGSGGTPVSSGTTGTGGTSGTSGTSGTTTTTPTPSIKFALTDSSGNTINTISSVVPGTVKATLKDAAGAVVPNSVVTFDTDPTLATITPAAGTALTDATGVASVTLNAVGSGAGTLTASAQVGTTPVTASLGYAVGISKVAVSAPTVGVAGALSAFGTTSLSVTVTSGGVPVTTPQDVTFSSLCAVSGKAVLSAAVATDAKGVATGSYRDNGCAGTDTITATAAGVTSPSTNLDVTAPSVGSIQFVSATPSSISLKGTGGIETSQVQFKVVDTGGNAISGKTVTFGLSTTVGGVTLTPSPSTATSDAAGLVVTNVNSGTVSTPVRVTASTPGATAGTTLTTQSSGLTITTGIPAQDSFSLSATKLNPEFGEVDGNTTVLTARLADHFRNPVFDGTVVNFTTEGGSIVASCQTKDGACSATMTGQAPRPADGRVTVLAYAVGEESFIDLNGNGVADLVPNEMIDVNGKSTDMPEAFRDDNENGVRDATETFIDYNGNNAFDGPDGQYNGVLCDNVTAPPTGSSAGTCSATKSIHARGSLVIVFSGSTAFVSQISPAGVINLNGCAPGGTTTQVDLRVVDAVGNPLPVGTTIVATTSDGTMVGTSTFTEPNTNITPAAGVKTHSVFIKDDSVTTVSGTPPVPTCTDPTASGFLTITVTTPGGAVAPVATSVQFPINN